MTPDELILVEAFRNADTRFSRITKDQGHILSLLLIGPKGRAELFE